MFGASYGVIRPGMTNSHAVILQADSGQCVRPCCMALYWQGCALLLWISVDNGDGLQWGGLSSPVGLSTYLFRVVALRYDHSWIAGYACAASRCGIRIYFIKAVLPCFQTVAQVHARLPIANNSIPCSQAAGMAARRTNDHLRCHHALD